MKKLSKEDCIQLLQMKYAELQNYGEERYPKRSDFKECEVNAIKSFLGPWPRALEKVGIKPKKNEEKD